MCQPRFWKHLRASSNGLGKLLLTGTRSDGVIFQKQLQNSRGTGDFTQTEVVEFVNSFEQYRSCFCGIDRECKTHSEQSINMSGVQLKNA